MAFSEKMSKKSEKEGLRRFNKQRLKFGVEFDKWTMDGFGLHREELLRFITPLLVREWFFYESMRVHVKLPRNRKGPEQNHESRVLSGF